MTLCKALREALGEKSQYCALAWHFNMKVSSFQCSHVPCQAQRREGRLEVCGSALGVSVPSDGLGLGRLGGLIRFSDQCGISERQEFGLEPGASRWVWRIWDKCGGPGEGIGGGTRLHSRDGNLCHLGIGIQRGRETKSPGLVGGWGDQVPMTREVSDKCQGVVWRSWDKLTAYVDLQHVS